jgi:hypothetical protein
MSGSKAALTTKREWRVFQHPARGRDQRGQLHLIGKNKIFTKFLRPAPGFLHLCDIQALIFYANISQQQIEGVL